MCQELKLASIGVDESSNRQFQLVLQAWEQLKVLSPFDRPLQFQQGEVMLYSIHFQIQYILVISELHFFFLLFIVLILHDYDTVQNSHELHIYSVGLNLAPLGLQTTFSVRLRL
jgi:hypothetical protein